MSMAMDAFNLDTAPMRIGKVRLRVRDLAGTSGFYQQVMGLSSIFADGGRVVLGTGTTPLLELAGDPALEQRNPRDAGLFHTAFLMPDRADLARWLAHFSRTGIQLQGASDHLVSEALYLADPEGNGIEVYADRPPSRWRNPDGEIHMATERLDLAALLSTAEGTEWSGFPEQGRIGHVHLQVGDTDEAERFYGELLGFDIASRYPGAIFFGSGGYHHQLAGNVWNSRRAGLRPEDAAGLDEVEIVLSDAAMIANISARAEAYEIPVSIEKSRAVLHDPWGTAIALSA